MLLDIALIVLLALVLAAAADLVLDWIAVQARRDADDHDSNGR